MPKTATQLAVSSAPAALADALMRRIFLGEYPPGSRLPPERQLATELGVDRTSLRMALRQLQRMNLIVPRHGSGIEVADYRSECGLDVLAAMFSVEDLPLAGSFMVEALDFWIESYSLTAAKAIVRMSLEELREIEVLLDLALTTSDVDELVDSQAQIQEALARFSGSVLFRMLSNSTRSLRRRFLYLLVDTVDLPSSIEHIKLMLRTAVLNRPTETLARQALDSALRAQTASLRERLILGTVQEPSRKAERKAPRKAQAARKRK